MNPTNPSQSRTHKMLFHNHLLIMELNFHQLSFTIFQQHEQNLIQKTQFSQTDLYSLIQSQEQEIPSLCEIFEDMKRLPEECMQLQKNFLKLRIKPLSKNKSAIPISLHFTPATLTERQSIYYIREYFHAKDENCKTEILKLKSQIYGLMTSLQDATNLIKSHSLMARHHREEVKTLKKQLETFKSEKLIIEHRQCQQCGVQSSFCEEMENSKGSTNCSEKTEEYYAVRNDKKLNTLAILLKQKRLQDKNIYPQNNCNLHGKTHRIQRASSELFLHNNISKGPMIGSGLENSPMIQNTVHNLQAEDHYAKLLEI